MCSTAATHIDALPIACCLLGNHSVFTLQALKVSIIHLVLLLCHVCAYVDASRLVAAVVLVLLVGVSSCVCQGWVEQASTGMMQVHRTPFRRNTQNCECSHTMTPFERMPAPQAVQTRLIAHHNLSHIRLLHQPSPVSPALHPLNCSCSAGSSTRRFGAIPWLSLRLLLPPPRAASSRLSSRPEALSRFSPAAAPRAGKPAS